MYNSQLQAKHPVTSLAGPYGHPFHPILVTVPIGAWVASQLGLGSIFSLAWRIGSWLFGFLLIVLVLAILYYFAPDVEQNCKWISPGSLFAALVWLLAVFGFRVYLMFSNPASGYVRRAAWSCCSSSSGSQHSSSSLAPR